MSFSELKKYYQELKDVKYVVGMQVGKTSVNSTKQLLAIAQLYSVYKDGFFEDESGKHPYITRSVDEQGQQYLTIDIDKIQSEHLITEPSKKISKYKKTSLKKAMYVSDTGNSGVDDITLEDMLGTDVFAEDGSVEFTAPLTCGNIKHQRFSKMDRTCWADICLFEKYDKNSLKISRFYIN